MWLARKQNFTSKTQNSTDNWYHPTDQPGLSAKLLLQCWQHHAQTLHKHRPKKPADEKAENCTPSLTRFNLSTIHLRFTTWPWLLILSLCNPMTLLTQQQLTIRIHKDQFRYSLFKQTPEENMAVCTSSPYSGCCFVWCLPICRSLLYYQYPYIYRCVYM